MDSKTPRWVLPCESWRQHC